MTAWEIARRVVVWSLLALYVVLCAVMLITRLQPVSVGIWTNGVIR